jgi:SET domain
MKRRAASVASPLTKRTFAGFQAQFFRLISTSQVPVALPSTRYFNHRFDHIKLVKEEGKGRSLISNIKFSKGDVVFFDHPLIAVSDPTLKSNVCCSVCFMRVSSSPISCPRGCGTVYCSESCKNTADSQGHDVICSSELPKLSHFCKTHAMSFPRAIAQLVARGFSENNDVIELFDTFNFLISGASSPSSSNTNVPIQYKEGYALVTNILRQTMDGNVEGFFHEFFSFEHYLKFNSIFQLNSFAIRCPIEDSNGERVAVDATQAAGMAAYLSSLVEEKTDRAAPCEQQSNGSASASHACDPTSESCCNNRGRNIIPEAPGGTAIYALSSMLNHSCDPNLDVVMSKGGFVEFRAREDIAPFSELHITYLDSSHPFKVRQARLMQGYGFTCTCRLCKTLK